jgi:hypothetical protein
VLAFPLSRVQAERVAGVGALVVQIRDGNGLEFERQVPLPLSFRHSSLAVLFAIMFADPVLYLMLQTSSPSG